MDYGLNPQTKLKNHSISIKIKQKLQDYSVKKNMEKYNNQLKIKELEKMKQKRFREKDIKSSQK